MNIKRSLLLILTFTFLSCNSLKNKSVRFSTEKLCNKWLYIDSYEGIITKIDTLNKEVKESKYGIPFLIYRKDGTYTNFQGDYRDNGKYIFDEKSGELREYYSEGVTKKESKSRLTYLDDYYMLIVVFEEIKESTSTFFYKKI